MKIIAAVVATIAVVVAGLVGPRAPSLGARTTGDPDLARAVRAEVENPRGYRGLAVALVDGGRIRVAGLGDSGNPRAAAVVADTSFEIGSVTKVLTGMLLADLASAGTVSPDDRLEAVLPIAGPSVREVTLAELASHRAGLPRLHIASLPEASRVRLRALRGADPYTGQDASWLARAAGTARPGRSRGTVAYSNIGAALLGRALAERAGTSYADLLRQRILEPVGMTATRVCVDGEPLPERRANGSTAAGRPVAAWTASAHVAAGSGVWSTAEDLGRLLAAVLGGTAPGADAVTPRFDAGENRRIGYGWFTDRIARPDTSTREITWHNGGTGGFRSYVGLERASGRAVAVLGNTDRPVDALGLRLLGVDAAVAGEDSAPGGLATIAMTVIFTFGGGLSLLVLGTNRGPRRWWRPAADRMRVTSGLAWAAATPALAAILGTWSRVPWWLWPLGVGLSAGAAAWALHRWRKLPTSSGGARWLRWPATLISVAAAIGAVAAVA